FGTLATLSASLITNAIGNALRQKSLVIRGLVGAIPPILINAFALPLIWVLLEVDFAYWINFGQIIATQTGTILIVGLPLMLAIARTPLVDEKVRLYKDKKVAQKDVDDNDSEQADPIE
ncbi:MAG: QueT transporter family protein, partial [Clostridiales bacterium]|nr:QueT transporter family protein [Clostridiales bacterium]